MLQYVCDNCGKTMSCLGNSNVVSVDFNSSESDGRNIHLHLCPECRDLFMDVINKKAIILRDPMIP